VSFLLPSATHEFQLSSDSQQVWSDNVFGTCGNIITISHCVLILHTVLQHKWIHELLIHEFHVKTVKIKWGPWPD